MTSDRVACESARNSSIGRRLRGPAPESWAPARFEQVAQRSAAIAQKFKFLGRFGQVHRQRSMEFIGQRHGLNEQLRMDRVGCVGTEARRREESRTLEMLSGRREHGFHAFKPRGNQLQKQSHIAGTRVIGLGRVSSLGDLADGRHTTANTLRQAQRDRAGVARFSRRRFAMCDHAPQPIDEVHALLADGLSQFAELQVRVGVHKARHDAPRCPGLRRARLSAGGPRRQSARRRWSRRRSPAAGRSREGPIALADSAKHCLMRLYLS